MDIINVKLLFLLFPSSFLRPSGGSHLAQEIEKHPSCHEEPGLKINAIMTANNFPNYAVMTPIAIITTIIMTYRYYCGYYRFITVIMIISK